MPKKLHIPGDYVNIAIGKEWLRNYMRLFAIRSLKELQITELDIWWALFLAAEAGEI